MPLIKRGGPQKPKLDFKAIRARERKRQMEAKQRRVKLELEVAEKETRRRAQERLDVEKKLGEQRLADARVDMTPKTVAPQQGNIAPQKPNWIQRVLRKLFE
jgi:hypothetical protein